jgi:hypothetical protein
MFITPTRVAVIAATLSLLPVSLLAQSANMGTASAGADQSIQAGQSEANRMVPASVVLLNTIDARKMNPGADFKAKLYGKVRLIDGPELPSGTIFNGTVVRDDMNDPRTRKIVLKFTTAQLKNGTEVPIKATIVGVYTPQNEVGYSYEIGASPDAPNSWNAGTLAVEQLDVTSGVDLRSKIAGNNSGVFTTSKKEDVKLSKGSDLNLAVAAGQGTQQSSAEAAPAGLPAGL